ncbi:MAG: hypothetical protein RMK30_08925 [Anaerolineae bacterium]|nr:hypothetical protein [Anaerolineae bacterium]MDW8102985.1 hypothetical protein [Anaerolineae bacterium]
MARKIREWGLREPAILALRIARPIGPILANGLFFLEPFIGLGKMKPLAGLLSQPEELLALLEGENDE